MSFEIYVAHPKEAWFPLGLRTGKEPKAVITVGRDLAKIGDRNFSPRPAFTKGQLSQLVLAEVWAAS